MQKYFKRALNKFIYIRFKLLTMKLHLLLLFSLVNFLLFAQLPTQTVRGTVFDSESNYPLSGAKIVIEVNGQKFMAAAASDGNFTDRKSVV